jgi:diguanylate cyclase (GGDEF)-like protein/PAS domain S-box-containing protein
MTTTDPKLPSVMPSWRNEARLASTITLVAITISLIVALAGPLGYLWLSYQSQITETSVAARLHAAFITLAIGEGGGDWKASVAGLIEAELTPSELPEQRSIVDATGTTIYSSGPELSAPRLVRTAPLLDRQRIVGAVVVARSLGPLFWRTLLVALVSSALGAATYLSLRVFPMRALRRTLGELRRHEGMARERAEEQLSIVLTTAIEGIVVFARSGAVLSCNPAAGRLLQYTNEELEGVSVSKLFQVGQEPASCEPLRVGQYEATAVRSTGTEFPVEIAVSEMQATGENRRIAVIRDITERKENEARLARLANFDSLTQLPNRSVFRDQLNRAMARAREGNSSLALMFLDLDRFKNVNDSLGHEVGDQLLVAVASVLAGLRCESSERVDAALGSSTHTVYRLGGDEFTVLIEGFRETSELIDLAQNVLAGLAQPFVIGINELFVSASIGIAVYTEPDTELDDLIRHADMAMYRSKELGRDMFYFYSEEINREAAGRHQLEAQLRHALARNEFQLHYQPKMDMRTSRVTGVEALLRWQPRGREIVGPDHFIPILEETGLIVSVGAWVIKTAFAQMIAWQNAGMRPITLAINFSARQFRRHNLIESIGEALLATGFDPNFLEIELTESMLIEDTLATARILRALSGLGISIAIDDFGTGHSSLTYLKRFDVDTLKIDRSFVRDMPEDPEDSAIASAVIALAHSLNLNVVAEGVETLSQMEFLIERGCDEMQGYLLSRPLEAEAFCLWFAEREALTAADAAVNSREPRLALCDTRLLREA